MDRDTQVAEWLRQFASGQEHYLQAKEAVRQAVVARLKDDGLNYHHVSARVKAIDSIEAKLRRRHADGAWKYPEGLDNLDDLLGIRVITYLEGDVHRARTALDASFKPLEFVDKTAEQKAKGGFGYSGHHLVLEVPNIDPPNGCGHYQGMRFEVQLRTVLQHAWAEFEHDVRYKSASSLPSEVHRAFTLASGLIELADKEFSAIETMVNAGKAVAAQVTPDPALNDSQHLTPDDLESLLERALPDNPRSRADHYVWLKDVLAANAVDTVEEVAGLLASADWEYISGSIDYRFAPGHVRAADDFFLMHFGDDYIERTKTLGEDQNRASKLQYRLRKMRGQPPAS